MKQRLTILETILAYENHPETSSINKDSLDTIIHWFVGSVNVCVQNSQAKTSWALSQEGVDWNGRTR